MDWIGASAREVARAVRRGDVSATQVLADHLDHIRVRNPQLNALRLVREAEAMAEAEQVDEQEDLAGAWLAGVPVAVKENVAVTGLPTWHGSAAAAGPVADADDEVVRRLRGAGAVVVGTSRMPELGLWATTDDPEVITRNPWDPTRTPGGSSGGAAAAVAAGLVPLAHGNDGFGSLRLPAACCGLVSLKPGRELAADELAQDPWFGMQEQGVLATTVADAAVGVAVLAGTRPTTLDEPARLRVAVSLRSPVHGVRADRANRQAVATAARLLAGAGHDTVAADLTYPMWFSLRGTGIWFAGAYRAAQAAGLDRAMLQARSRRHVALGQWATRRGLATAQTRTRWREHALSFLDTYEVLLTPVLAGRPPAAGPWAARSWPANALANVRYAPYAAPWNIAGLPAIAVPAGRRPDGLPVGVQLVGRPGSERLLLGLAGQLEQAAPWPRHAPLR